MADDPKPPEKPEAEPKPETPAPPQTPEVGGRTGLEPTRYGDWEKGGIAVDF
ncbi:DUF1674 domain-containing protein [Sphingoaurantiacus capsulatus]|uniref:DUF1674 domain-containing protein n=1 Tax=Sphingoaurantiacus capsulatus TaxID=1771310 RepID=A0ABV7XHT5_9SPHN